MKKWVFIYLIFIYTQAISQEHYGNYKVKIFINHITYPDKHGYLYDVLDSAVVIVNQSFTGAKYVDTIPYNYIKSLQLNKPGGGAIGFGLGFFGSIITGYGVSAGEEYPEEARLKVGYGYLFSVPAGILFCLAGANGKQYKISYQYNEFLKFKNRLITKVSKQNDLRSKKYLYFKEKNHLFSNHEIPDRFVLKAKGETLAKAKISFKIFDYRGLIIYQDNFHSGNFMENNGLAETYNNSSDCMAIANFLHQFFNSKNFNQPAFTDSIGLISTLNKRIKRNIFRKNPGTITFQYTCGSGIIKQIAYSKRSRSVKNIADDKK